MRGDRNFRRGAIRGGFLCLSVLAAAGAYLPASAQGATPASAPARGPTLQESLAGIVARHEKESQGAAGLSVVELSSGKTLAAVRQGEPFTPASNAKILTSAFALARLGASFRFSTAVYFLGSDLVVVGDGDPTVGDPVLARQKGRSIYAEVDQWAQAVRQVAGGRILGDVLVCGVSDPSAYRHEDWPESQYHNWYAAPVAGLNFHDNCLDVTFKIYKGDPAAVVQPYSRFMRYFSSVRLGKEHIWSLRLTEEDSLVSLNGTVRGAAADPISVPVNNPPMLLGRVLADRLVRVGVVFHGKVRTIRPQDIPWKEARPVACTRGPLTEALARSNKASLNLAAECLFLRAGNGSWSGSADLAERTLREVYGLPAGSFAVRDGSGLSRGNRVTPAAMTKLLTALATGESAAAFLDSLAISGVDGSLASRLSEEPYRGRIRGKTGAIAGVSALSGYVLGEDGKPALAFAILFNRLSAGARDVQDAICRVLVSSLKPASPIAPAKDAAAPPRR